ncbi:MAG: hypothetical protein IPK19_24965 [Chloroflexi bacterium]|nr:hypothetical protein [Chloroflexota bacterium]
MRNPLNAGEGQQSDPDIDASAAGDTLIACRLLFLASDKTSVSTALLDARLRLDEAVLKWQAVKAELQELPIGHNYDFSRYARIIAVVCTPNAVYTESDLSLSYEVGKLRKSATASELIEWLNT